MAVKKGSRKTSKKRPSAKAARKAPARKKQKPVRSARGKVPPVPKDTHTVTPHLCFQDSAFAIAFYEQAFGAKEIMRLAEPGGRIGHAALRIGDSVIMMADENPQIAVLSAKTLNGSPIRISLAVKNVDAFFARAVAAGATVIRPVQDEFYGWRTGVVLDPFGYSWMIMSQVEVVSPREMQKRFDKLIAAHKPESGVA